MNTTIDCRKLWDTALPGFEKSHDLVQKYMDALLAMNHSLNFISRKLSADDVFVDHILDCALAAPYIKKGETVLDFGTGGGLPGVVLALCQPQARFVLYDKSPKKMTYLARMVKALRCANVSLASAPEDLPDGISTLTSRAVGPIAKVLTLVDAILVEPPARCLFYKGRRESVDEDIATMNDGKYESSVHVLPYPGGLKQRHLVELKLKK